MTDKQKSQLDALKALDAMPASAPKPKAHAEHSHEPAHKAKPAKNTQSETGRQSKEHSQKKHRNTELGDVTNQVVKMLRGDMLGGEKMKHQVWLILLICLYGLLVIGMRYRVETLQKDKNATLERISYLREHKIEMQKQYQKSIKISEIADDLDSVGVGLISGPPYEI